MGKGAGGVIGVLEGGLPERRMAHTRTHPLPDPPPRQFNPSPLKGGRDELGKGAGGVIGVLESGLPERRMAHTRTHPLPDPPPRQFNPSPLLGGRLGGGWEAPGVQAAVALGSGPPLHRRRTLAAPTPLLVSPLEADLRITPEFGDAGRSSLSGRVGRRTAKFGVVRRSARRGERLNWGRMSAG